MTRPLEVDGDRPPLPLPKALASLTRCAWRTVALLTRREISQPTVHLDQVLCFADGTHGRVYRETIVQNAMTDRATVVMVEFRLRWVHGRGHTLFRSESLLNTPLFVGFPGFVSKLWVAHDERNVYRGVYQWSDEALAHAYVRALWWVLALVSERRSIHYVVLPGLRRDELLSDPTILQHAAPHEPAAWWRLVSIQCSSA